MYVYVHKVNTYVRAKLAQGAIQVHTYLPILPFRRYIFASEEKKTAQ